jgi:hypothetical protein
MNIKKAYYYLFYTFWGFFENSPTKWGTVWKAGALIIILEIFIVFIMLNFYGELFNDYYDIQIFSPELIIPAIGILILNYWMFSKDDKWKEYALEFNRSPRKKNILGSTIVLIFVAVVVVLLVYSFYLIKPIYKVS